MAVAVAMVMVVAVDVVAGLDSPPRLLQLHPRLLQLHPPARRPLLTADGTW